jgi:hypothetical protein
MDKAQAVAEHKTSYKPLMQEMGNTARFGSTEDIVKTVQSFEIMRETNRHSLANMNKDDIAFITAVENRMETTNDPLDEIVSNIREQVYNKKDPEVRERLSKFSKDKSVSLDRIEDVLKNQFDSNKLGFIDLPGGEPDLAEGVAVHAQNLIRDGYVKTGNLDDAKAYAEQQFELTAKVNQINGANTLMVNAPTAVFPEFSTAELQTDLHASLRESMGKDFDVESVEIVSYAGTRGIRDSRTGREIVNYMVITRGPFGEEEIVQGEDGPLMWAVDDQALRANLTKEALADRIEQIAADKKIYTERKAKQKERQENPLSSISDIKSIR